MRLLFYIIAAVLIAGWIFSVSVWGQTWWAYLVLALAVVSMGIALFRRSM